VNHHDDPRGLLDATERELSDGFEAVMESLKRMSPQEITALKQQADAAELGHDAYALGLELLEQGQTDAAERQLRKAARYHVAGARRILDELTVRGVMHQTADAAAGGVALSASHRSLARGATSTVPGAIFALALTGGISLAPGDGHEILFGRDRGRVHVCVGEDDPHVSRHQGTLTHGDGQWQVRNTGWRPIRINHRLLFRDEEPLPLGTGYTQLFIESPRRQHLLEVYVTDHRDQRPEPRHRETTVRPRVWALTEQERLVLVALGQRYLSHDLHPQPLSWKQTAAQLAGLQPDRGWTQRRVEHIVHAVRRRLSDDGVPGLVRDEVGEPVGNALNHNLLQALLTSTTLVPMDLALIDET
jgi:hypothetical protein